MRQLPNGWTWTTLGEILDRVEAGRSFGAASRPAEMGEWGIIRVSAMTWGEFRPDQNKAVAADDKINYDHEIRQGDILLSRANTAEYVGASVRVRVPIERLLLSDKSLRLVPTMAVDPDFLVRLLGSPIVRRQISTLATGTKDSMRNISQNALRRIDLPLPSYSEQLRIVSELNDHLLIIRRLDEAIQIARARAASLEGSLFEAAFDGKLVDQDPTDEPADVLLARIRAQREGAAAAAKTGKPRAVEATAP